VTSVGPNQQRFIPYHERHFGGLAITAPSTSPKLVFIGVIDILTNYGFRKRLEHGGKACINPRKWRGVSCCPPVMYAERFIDFMENRVFIKQAPDRKHLHRSERSDHREHHHHHHKHGQLGSGHGHRRDGRKRTGGGDTSGSGGGTGTSGSMQNAANKAANFAAAAMAQQQQNLDNLNQATVLNDNDISLRQSGTGGRN